MTDWIGVDMPESTESPVWRVHPDHPNIEVSTWGDVRTSAYIGDGIDGRLGWHYAQRIRKQTISSDGYATVQIGRIMMKTHALVLAAFVGPKPLGTEVLHRDANRGNPRLDNLRYGTRSENQLQRVSDGNHHHANKTHCKRGHLLVPPNLRKQGLRNGKRQCLACERAMQWLRCHGQVGDVQALSDAYLLAYS